MFFGQIKIVDNFEAANLEKEIRVRFWNCEIKDLITQAIVKILSKSIEYQLI